MKGGFVTLEGIEGAGKTTVAAALIAMLEERGYTVQATREPGGTPLAEQLRGVLLSRGSEMISPVAETLLMFAARSIHLENRIRPALARGEWIICDRYTDATRAYQGAGRAVDTEWIEQLARAVHAGIEPDLTLLLDFLLWWDLSARDSAAWRVVRTSSIVSRAKPSTSLSGYARLTCSSRPHRHNALSSSMRRNPSK